MQTKNPIFANITLLAQQSPNLVIQNMANRNGASIVVETAKNYAMGKMGGDISYYWNFFLEAVRGLGPNSSASKHYTANRTKQRGGVGTLNGTPNVP
jgi:hypothetical protein